MFCILVACLLSMLVARPDSHRHGKEEKHHHKDHITINTTTDTWVRDVVVSQVNGNWSRECNQTVKDTAELPWSTLSNTQHSSLFYCLMKVREVSKHQGSVCDKVFSVLRNVDWSKLTLVERLIATECMERPLCHCHRQ